MKHKINIIIFNILFIIDIGRELHLINNFVNSKVIGDSNSNENNIIKEENINFPKSNKFFEKETKIDENIGDLNNNEVFVKEDICQTKECYNAANELKSIINFDVNPCEDFFEFACGGWTKKHPLPATEQSWGPFMVANHQISVTLRDLLESSNKINDSDLLSVKAAKHLYNSCMNTGKNIITVITPNHTETQGLKPIIELTNLFGGWPILNKYWQFKEFDWQIMLAKTNNILLFRPIISIGISTDLKNTSQHVIHVDQPSLVVLRQMLIAPDLYKQQISAYKKFIEQVVDLFLQAYSDYNNDNDQKNNDDNDSFKNDINYDAFRRISDEVEELVQFEINIAKLMSPPELRRDGARLYNKMTIEELQMWTDLASVNVDKNHHSTIDWLKLIGTTFNDSTNIQIKSSDTIIVREQEYIFNLVKLLRNTPIKTIANYLNWRLIEEFSNDLTINLRNLNFQFHRIFTGAAEEQPRWKECVRTVQFVYGLSIGYKYTQLYFDEKSKQSAIEMVNNIRNTFQDQMLKVSWMDQNTKTAALEKIKAMEKFIGYPDWYANNITYLEEYYKGLVIGPDHFLNMVKSRNFLLVKMYNRILQPVDRNEWPPHEPPVTVNAFYNVHMNAIIFPAAVLQPPFFSKGRPDALNYGGIGVVIGHEMTHGFDDMGRQYNKYGSLSQWWSEQTLNNYLNKTKCFIDQYNNFEVPELNEVLFRPVTLNGLLTLGENMADNGGLHQAYIAYKKQYREQNGKRRKRLTIDDIMSDIDRIIDNDGTDNNKIKNVKDFRLPGLEMFSSDQLFFLGFASNWCETQTTESLLHEVLSNPHSPHKYRVIGTVTNSPEFASAFKCPLGSPMNPERKCTLW